MGDIYKVGQLVEINDGRKGRIRYVGDFHVKPGSTWVGIELTDASGKNDGEVQGKRYFQCEPNHGMFVQPQGIGAILEQAPAAVKKTAPVGNGAATKPGARTSMLGRPAGAAGATASTTTSTAAKRQSLMEGSKARQTLNSASPTPASRTGAARPAAATTSARPGVRSSTTTTTTTTTATARAATSTSTTAAGTGLAAKRNSLAGSSSLAAAGGAATTRSRTSTIGAAGPGARAAPTTTAAARKPLTRPTAGTAPRAGTTATARATATRRLSTDRTSNEEGGGDGDEGEEEGESDAGQTSGSRPMPRQRASSSAKEPASAVGTSSREPPSAGLSRPTTQQLSAQNRKIEDLETKLRVMEKQQLESRDRLKDFEKLQSERDRFEGLIQKLNAKLQPQHEEIQQLRKDVRDLTTKLEEAEKGQVGIDDELELAAVDREMAEELAEGYKAELDALRIKHEELSLEADILKAENEDLGREMSPEERNSVGFVQLEKSNERLREALIRLRDVTQDTEADFKQKIKELEEDLEELSSVKPKYEESQEQLNQSEALVDELKQQLETAQGSEDILEELTDKNMSLSEQIEELRAAVQDLEDLKEINDELELNHIEHEKSMQEDIDYRDSLILEQARKSTEQDATIEELEYSLARFRDLVTNLNADLEEMRASQQITEAEANELTSRSKAMMDMNMRLQQSAAKTQVRVIDNELKRLEAQESSDHLTIVKRFLPDSYTQHQDCTTTFLRFKRLSFKASMLHGFQREKAAGNAVSGSEDDMFASCDLLNKLTWVSTVCQRFVKFIVSSPLETWEQMAGTAYDLEPVERAFNNWIDALKRDELKETQCAAELQRSMSVLEHLSERFFGEGLADYSEEVHLHATMIQSQLDSAAAALSQIKQISSTRVVLPSDADEDDEQEVEAFNSRADAIVAQVKSIRVVAAKSLQQLDELTARGLTLEPSTQGSIETAHNVVEAFAATCHSAGLKLAAVINDDSRTENLTYEQITNAISPDDATPFSSLSNQANSINNTVQSFSTLTTTLSATVEFNVPPAADDLDAQSTPWSQLAAQLNAQKAASADLDAEIARLQDTVSERSTALALKDKTISELDVTIEVLQKRADDGSKAVTKARSLEKSVEEIMQKHEQLQNQVREKTEAVHKLQAEKDTWKMTGIAAGGADGGIGPMDENQMARAMEDMAEGGYIPARAAQELEVLRAELEATQSVVRQLRQAATDASLQAALSDGILQPLNAEEPLDARKQHALAAQKEAMDAMRELRKIVNRSVSGTDGNASGNFTMKATDKSDRLKWRPAHERLGWQIGAKREEWEAWREWVRDVAREGERGSERREKLAAAARVSETAAPRVLARLRLRSPPDLASLLPANAGGKKGRQQENKPLPFGGEIKIVDPTEWDTLSSRLGVGYS